jgi:two-component system alkaline phosphatase synthesis response regulator PhoP
VKKINKKILIVEDDPNFIAILKQKFNQEGFTIFTAQDGKDGLNMALKEEIDLVISDVLLPLLTGVEMVKKIKEKKNDLPIVLLTNVKDNDYSDLTKNLKKIDYLIKSDVRIDEILKIVEKKLGIK